MKLSLSSEAREARKRKVVHVVSVQSKQDEVKNLSSDLALELSEAKSEISRLKKELVNQQIKISNNFKAMRIDEIRAANDLFEDEKRSLIQKLTREHSQQLFEINREHEAKLQHAVLEAINQPVRQAESQKSYRSRYNSDDNLVELDRQYDRDNGLLDPVPYDPEYE